MKKYGCVSYDEPKPRIENINNPSITIINQMGCCNNVPTELTEAAILDYTNVEFECVGDDFKNVGQLEFTLDSPDPIKITCNVNWIYELYNPYPGCQCSTPTTCEPGTAVAEFVLTKTVVDDDGKTLLAETEIGRATDTAPEVYMPTTTFLSNLDTDAGLYPGGKATYKLYVRSTRDYIKTIEPFLYLARQYPSDLPEASPKGKN